MRNLEIIREACIKANPEIMELKFGCLIHCKDFKDFPNTIRPYAGYKFSKELDRNVAQVLSSGGQLHQMDENHEILGRPIRLADVLLALDVNSTDPYWKIGASSSLFVIQYGEDKCVWFLREDDLRHQSEETLEFLANLLK